MPDNVIDFTTRQPRKRRPTRASQAIPIPHGAHLTQCLESWTLALESANKSPKTIRSYTDVARKFVAYLADNSLPCDAERVAAEHVRAFLVAERERTSAASADVAWRNLHVWFGWLCSDEIGERTTASPVLKKDRPNVPAKVRQYISPDEQRQLLATAAGKSFEDRRDRALMTILYDSGPRASGIMGVRWTPRDPGTHDVDLRGRRLRIVLKGGDELWLPLGATAAQALDRYLRARSGHSKAQTSPWLWLGIQGRNTSHMSPEGLRDMLARRAGQAGIRKVTPHDYRGTATHELLKSGAGKEAVQRILGWKTADMVDHYSDGLADERAREIHARHSPADRLGSAG
ncbi:tyrosine-type recombinase/integrase [Nonomuraea sp. NPDC049486]|uniref:tyrosine-type recombinase/integrase n=1 Tax=Nonomuraea sp. NPDC049486 TaxID=3155773 RepID=UPI003420D4E4